MKLYLLKRLNAVDWDQYDSFVIEAMNPVRARELAALRAGVGDQETWRSKDTCKVTELKTSGKEQIVIGSFNAG